MWLACTFLGWETNTGWIANAGQLREMKERMEKIRRKMDRLEKRGKQQAGKVMVTDEYPHPETNDTLVPMRCMEHRGGKQAQTDKRNQSSLNPSRKTNHSTQGQDTLALYHFFTHVAEQNTGAYTPETNRGRDETDEQTTNPTTQPNISSREAGAPKKVDESNQSSPADLES